MYFSWVLKIAWIRIGTFQSTKLRNVSFSLLLFIIINICPFLFINKDSFNSKFVDTFIGKDRVIFGV